MSCPSYTIEKAVQALLETHDPVHEELCDELTKYVFVKKTYSFYLLKGMEESTKYDMEILCKPIEVMSEGFVNYVRDSFTVITKRYIRPDEFHLYSTVGDPFSFSVVIER